MDPTQQKALNALESFILLSKSATSPRPAADLVTQATSAPNTYVFAELLQTPNISALKSAPAEYSSYHQLLEIFAWGTWSDYSSQSHLPKLSEQQAHKLRQLTLLSLSIFPSNLTYPHLLQALFLPSVRALEDLVISSIYSGLLTAKLNTQSQRVDVSSVSPLRDLRPGSIPTLISSLDAWNTRCVSVLDDLENQVRDVKHKALERRKREVRDGTAMENLVMDAKKGMPTYPSERGKVLGGKRGAQEVGAAVDDGDDAMQLDEERGGGRLRGVKRGSGGIKNAARKMMG
ncbi:MAG: hypothetical protein Q9170_002832 [Blastenia crenularia]